MVASPVIDGRLLASFIDYRAWWRRSSSRASRRSPTSATSRVGASTQLSAAVRCSACTASVRPTTSAAPNRGSHVRAGTHRDQDPVQAAARRAAHLRRSPDPHRDRGGITLGATVLVHPQTSSDRTHRTPSRLPTAPASSSAAPARTASLAQRRRVRGRRRPVPARRPAVVERHRLPARPAQLHERGDHRPVEPPAS